MGLTLAAGKRLLAGVQPEIVAAQAGVHAVRRPECRSCGTACRMKDYRQHAIATLFGQVTVRLPRFRCAGCGATEAGVAWPSPARSTPELERLGAQLSALMPYRTAAEVLAQMVPVDAGTRERARDAAERVAVAYRPLPAVVEAIAALAMGAPLLLEEAQTICPTGSSAATRRQSPRPSPRRRIVSRSSWSTTGWSPHRSRRAPRSAATRSPPAGSNCC